MNRANDISIRNGSPADHHKIVSVMTDWWGGRDLSSLALKIFFIHFNNTIYIAENDDGLIGFLVGFLSQSEEEVGYIHLVGVHPSYRKRDIGRLLYHRFFNICLDNDRSVVKSCTSPVNKLSITFHMHLGFVIEPGDGNVDGVPVTLDFLATNDPKVLFRKDLRGNRG